VTTREPAIRRQPYQRQHCCITCIHRLSKSILHGANAERPTRVITQVGRWCRPREQWKGLGVPSHRSPLRSRTIRTADLLPVRGPHGDAAAGQAFARIHVASRRGGRGAANPGVMRPAKSWQRGQGHPGHVYAAPVLQVEGPETKSAASRWYGGRDELTTLSTGRC
jgi:hypothetical protein